MDMGKEIETLQRMIDESRKIVFFGGAGVSTESGIPDFRSVDGLYNQKYDYPPETILSHTFYVKRSEEFFRFYRDKMLCLDAKPNTAHKALARLEQMGKLTAVVTQNIDGLHQAAGSKRQNGGTPLLVIFTVKRMTAYSFLMAKKSPFVFTSMTAAQSTTWMPKPISSPLSPPLTVK